MQTHVVQLTKQRLSDFFVKEDGHVAHKNALSARTFQRVVSISISRNSKSEPNRSGQTYRVKLFKDTF